MLLATGVVEHGVNQVRWDDYTKDFSIAIKEIVPIIIAAVIWGSGYRVCDNKSIVTVINSHYSKESHVMSTIQTLFFRPVCSLA